MTLTPITHGSLLPFQHGFFTRKEGVSSAPCETLNCGLYSKDTPYNLHKNYTTISAYFGIKSTHLMTVKQTHSADVITIKCAQENAFTLGEADALVTCQPKICLSIVSADCQPILFADKYARVIGVAHAGWKGAKENIIENTIKKMEKLGATRENICAVIGPAISQNAYEVGAEFRENFVTNTPENAFFFKPQTHSSHFNFDLIGYSRAKLQKAGLQKIASINMCTYSHPQIFFSYRYAKIHNLPDDGRQISAIMI